MSGFSNTQLNGRYLAQTAETNLLYGRPTYWNINGDVATSTFIYWCPAVKDYLIGMDLSSFPAVNVSCSAAARAVTGDFRHGAWTELRGGEWVPRRDVTVKCVLCDTKYADVLCADRQLFAVPKMLNAVLTYQIDLSNNRISTVKKDDFANMTSLLKLDLSYNKLVELDAGAFDGLTGLVLLHLFNNQLTNFNDGLFKDLTHLQELRFETNK